jgi:uncharacterized protein YqkB
MRLYVVTLNTYYQCGDYEDDDSVLIGVYSNLHDARQVGEDHLLMNFAYDVESGVFYSSGCDEAWISIWECGIDEKIDLNKPPVLHIPEKEANKNGI